MSTRIIVVPKDSEAMQALDADQASDGQLLSLKLEEPQFQVLWNRGIFELINSWAKSNIDAFEDESITTAESLKYIVKNETLNWLRHDLEVGDLIRQLLDLFQEALDRKTGVFFFF